MATRRLPASERRRLILLAAIRVFARSGFHGSTTKEIAAEAEVAEALLYRYFPSKQALFLEAMSISAQRLISAIEEIFTRNERSPAGAITELLAVYRTMVERHADFAKMVFVISAELDDPQVRDAYLPFQERGLQVIERAVRRWQDAGLLSRQVPGRAAAWLLMGCFQVVALMKHTGKLGELHIEPAMGLVEAFMQQGVDTQRAELEELAASAADAGAQQ